jgi:hypothetical protein
MNRTKRAALVVALACLWGNSDAQEVTVGMHLYSAHLWPSQGYQNVTPGIYAEHRGWVAGGYSNSEGGGSVYAGHMWRSVFGTPLDVMVGAVTGYKRAAVLPMLVPSIRLPLGLRLSYVPAPGKDSSFHLSIETTIE